MFTKQVDDTEIFNLFDVLSQERLHRPDCVRLIYNRFASRQISPKTTLSVVLHSFSYGKSIDSSVPSYSNIKSPISKGLFNVCKSENEHKGSVGEEVGAEVGLELGPAFGILLGDPNGDVEGLKDGFCEGEVDGVTFGDADGCALGLEVGTKEGKTDGTDEGPNEGITDGVVLGPNEGIKDSLDGAAIGSDDGFEDGMPLGAIVGALLGASDGALVRLMLPPQTQHASFAFFPLTRTLFKSSQRLLVRSEQPNFPN